MQPIRIARLLIAARFLIAAAAFLAGNGARCLAQQEPASQSVEMGIIVTASKAEALDVLRQLNAGWDFAVLAKERSIDPTSIDGGYLGRMTPSQLADLRPELKDAINSHVFGQSNAVFPVSSGFAILKGLPAAPPAEDLNNSRIAALISSGAIRFGIDVSGMGLADTLVNNYPKPDGWNRDLRHVCEVRKQSYAAAVQQLTNTLAAAKGANSSAYSASDVLAAHLTLSQLQAYAGNMQQLIEQLKLAQQAAQASVPAQVHAIEQRLGIAYLHLSEMENGVYRDSADLDIFPPLDPGKSFEKKNESRLAVQYFTSYLAQDTDDLQVKWLLNLAYMTLGEYPAGVPKEYLIPEAGFLSKQNVGRFVDIAPAAGLNVSREAGGVIVDDFDNDGLLDIVVSSMDVCDPIKFFHNNGDGTFTDRTVEAGLADQLGGLNIVQADFNNDGCMDLLVLRGGWSFAQRKSLLRNNCNGTFTDVTEQSGLADAITATQTAVWADIDKDGYLDLFVGNENAPAQLFRNKGDGTFEDISHSAGIDQLAFTKGVTAADYDQDGYVDLYVSNLNGPNLLYHNNGNGTFTDVARQAGVQAPGMGFATWFFDYDNDGWPDIFVTSYVVSVAESLKTYIDLPHNAPTLKLYRNKHDGTFEDVTAKVGLDKVFMPMGAGFGDVDNDGFLDIYLGMGNPSFGGMLPHTLLRNDAGKSFVDITASSGTGELHKGHGIAFADLDRSGNEAIVANCGGAVPADRHTLRVMQNPGNSNDWINVRLVGVKSNRAGVGAQIKITVTDDGQAPRTIYRVVGENSSFGGNPMEQHIGLGHNAQIAAIDVWWPASNTRQHFTGVDKNQYIEIKESSIQFNKLNRPSFRLGAPSLAGNRKVNGQMQTAFGSNTQSLPGGVSRQATALPR